MQNTGQPAKAVCDGSQALATQPRGKTRKVCRALWLYVARADKDLNLLMEYADILRVRNVARRYLEVLL